MGTRLLLCSVAGTAAAAGASVGRWLLIEAGEVLSLLADGGGPPGDDRACREHAANVGNETHSDFASHPPFDRCNDDAGHYLTDAGGVLRAIAASPHLRAAPLILLVLSSSAMVIGVVLTHSEFRKYRSWVQTCLEYGEECSQQLMAAMGASNSDELAEKMEEKHVQWKRKLLEQVDKSMDSTDGLVLDDVLRKWVRAGADLSMGLWGGILLYSLSDEIFVDPANGAKRVRRRLIRAADPNLEQILFRPGGVWDALPPSLREYFTRGTPQAIKLEAKLEGSVSCPEITSMDSSLGEPMDEDESNDNCEEGSNYPPLADRALVVSVSGDVNDQVVDTGGGEKISIQIDGEECLREKFADVLSSAVKDLVISNFMGSRMMPSVDHEKRAESQRMQDLRHGQPCESPPPPSPQLQLEKILQRTTIVATFLYLCHLRGSSSARRSWGSAMNFLASLGLASAAVGAGVASALLHSNAEKGAVTSHPITGIVCSKVLDKLRNSQVCALPMDVGSRIQRTFERLREEIRRNKRLRVALAFAVLGGMGRLFRKGRAGCRKGIR